jgi:hypothetical protein
MKRALILILLFFSILSGSGCKHQSYGIIPFENKNAIMECTVNNKFDVIIKKEDNALSLEVCSPKEIEGIKFVFTESDSYAFTEDTKIPIDKKAYSGIYAIASILDIKEEMSISASNNGHGASVIFIKDGRNYSFGYDSGGYLVSVDIKSPDFTYSIIINGLKIQ